MMREAFSPEARQEFLQRQERLVAEGKEMAPGEIKEKVAFTLPVEEWFERLFASYLDDPEKILSVASRPSTALQEAAVVDDLLYSLKKNQDEWLAMTADTKTAVRELEKEIGALASDDPRLGTLHEQLTMAQSNLVSEQQDLAANAAAVRLLAEKRANGLSKMHEFLEEKELTDLVADKIQVLVEQLLGHAHNLFLQEAGARATQKGEVLEKRQQATIVFLQRLDDAAHFYLQNGRQKQDLVALAVAHALQEVKKQLADSTISSYKVFPHQPHPELKNFGLAVGDHTVVIEDPEGTVRPGVGAELAWQYVYAPERESRKRLRLSQAVRRIVVVKEVDPQEKKITVSLAKDYFQAGDLVRCTDCEIGLEAGNLAAAEIPVRLPDGQLLHLSRAEYAEAWGVGRKNSPHNFLRLVSGGRGLGKEFGFRLVTMAAARAELGRRAYLDRALADLINRRLGFSGNLGELQPLLQENLVTALQATAGFEGEEAATDRKDFQAAITTAVEIALQHCRDRDSFMHLVIAKISSELETRGLFVGGDEQQPEYFLPEWRPLVESVVNAVWPAPFPDLEVRPGRGLSTEIISGQMNMADRRVLAQRLKELSEQQPIEVVAEVKLQTLFEGLNKLRNSSALKKHFTDTEWFTPAEMEKILRGDRLEAALNAKVERIITQVFSLNDPELVARREGNFPLDLDGEYAVRLLRDAGLRIKVIPMVPQKGGAGREYKKGADLFVDISHGTGLSLNRVSGHMNAAGLHEDRLVIFLDEGGGFHSGSHAVNTFLSELGFYPAEQNVKQEREIWARKLMLAFVNSVDQYKGPAFDHAANRALLWERGVTSLYGHYGVLVESGLTDKIMDYFVTVVAPQALAFIKQYKKKQGYPPSEARVENEMLSALMSGKKEFDVTAYLNKHLSEDYAVAKSFWIRRDSFLVENDLARNGFVINTRYGRLLVDVDNALPGWQGAAFGAGYDGYVRYFPRTNTCIVNITGFKAVRGDAPERRLPYGFLMGRDGKPRAAVEKEGRYAVMPPDGKNTVTLSELLAALLGGEWHEKISPQLRALCDLERANLTHPMAQRAEIMQRYAAEKILTFQPYRLRPGEKPDPRRARYAVMRRLEMAENISKEWSERDRFAPTEKENRRRLLIIYDDLNAYCGFYRVHERLRAGEPVEDYERAAENFLDELEKVFRKDYARLSERLTAEQGARWPSALHCVAPHLHQLIRPDNKGESLVDFIARKRLEVLAELEKKGRFTAPRAAAQRDRLIEQIGAAVEMSKNLSRRPAEEITFEEWFALQQLLRNTGMNELTATPEYVGPWNLYRKTVSAAAGALLDDLEKISGADLYFTMMRSGDAVPRPILAPERLVGRERHPRALIAENKLRLRSELFPLQFVLRPAPETENKPQ